jgi:UDP-glucose 4-epimerase
VEAIESATGEKMDLRYDKPQPGDQSRSCLDSSLIKQVLSWKPQTDLTQGIKKTIEWSRSQKDKDEQ